MSINWDNVEFKDDKRFLSNMFPVTVVIDGISYPSPENYYMSMKFATVCDKLVTELQECTPLNSKTIANKNKDKIRPDWDDIKLGVMRVGVMAKFAQNTSLVKQLLDTGDEYLEERNDWNDTFWGTYQGKGSNHLGSLLMEVRNYYKGLL